MSTIQNRSLGTSIIPVLTTHEVLKKQNCFRVKKCRDLKRKNNPEGYKLDQIKNNHRSLLRYHEKKKAKEREELINREDLIVQRIAERLKSVSDPVKIKRNLRVNVKLSDIFGNRDSSKEESFPAIRSKKVLMIVLMFMHK